MKHLVSTLATVLVVWLPMPAIAGLWGFEEQFADRENVPTEEVVQSIYDQIEGAEDIQAGADNVLAMYQSIFEPAAVKIPMRIVNEDGEVLGSSALYFSDGELFNVHDFYPEAGNTRSFITQDGQLYTWQNGETTGQILTRFTGDTVELTDYIIDFSVLMRSTYNQYLRSPDQFTATVDEGVTTLIYNEESQPFVGIRFTEDPLWMRALLMEFEDCAFEGCTEEQADMRRVTLEVDPPIPLEEVPADVKQLPEDVTFEPSEQTADSFMRFL
ncbi:MAG: hypothetical protein AAFN40_20600 [Cyanobacteria bacterium J06560_6]